MDFAVGLVLSVCAAVVTWLMVLIVDRMTAIVDTLHDIDTSINSLANRIEAEKLAK